MNIWKKLTYTQLGQNWKDRTVRGRGNKACRRAFAIESKADRNLRANMSEPIAEYPAFITRGAILTDCCKSAATAKFSRY